MPIITKKKETNANPYLPVRQLMDKQNIFDQQDWRFLMVTEQDEKGGLRYKIAEDGKPEVIFIARRLLQVSNQELEKILSQNADKGLRLATTNEVVDAHRPFDDSAKVFGNYQYPWGRNMDFSDAQEAFIYQGLSRSGILWGHQILRCFLKMARKAVNGQ